jgi:hypothetical protein
LINWATYLKLKLVIAQKCAFRSVCTVGSLLTKHEWCHDRTLAPGWPDEFVKKSPKM